ncbi:hypothetical protein [Micromonospora sp. WMMD812]|uniref:hypothetical protein n=1 Tax=Micromonospora sp. WMMD812 TaxID=3015152 RepID=UPI00248CA974|nr:hypothetical protein [Micromonospora sp. WMMD812]WBB71186.1 hypothetical protein O7603_03030 [Micromonospora sp. WMMD812]
MTKYGQDISLDVVDSNGQEAVLVRRAESVVALGAIDASPEGIVRVLLVLNPARLAGFRPIDATPRGRIRLFER